VHAVYQVQPSRLILLPLCARSRDKVERHPGSSYTLQAEAYEEAAHLM
jgi:hypothetical protein